MKPKIAVFAYNFSHKKTQDFLIYLFLRKYDVAAVFAANAVSLDIPDSTIHWKIKHQGLIEPKVIAKKLEIPYYELNHDNPKITSLVKSKKIDIGVISGARILKKEIIDAFPKGIINFHPGLIPEARGLDALLWSVYRDIPPGVTSHLINEKIDSGHVLLKERIMVKSNDTLLDLSERINEKQIEMLIPSLEVALKGEMITIPNSHYNRKMPPELEQDVISKLPEYIKKYVNA